ncbi:rhodopsin, GQ-coupled-like isoform X1 [Branchiostoma floridae]|uniref:Rhodopsin, GQ-coupled-like isoform X1 n=1 Tax=Branchiostoma floridae TaxID=7739 RepID=A0A9J7KPD0_BRAFL|nr:rhodopsin, GQ-coupled-like isoform X1 [Branchiostoma floridae]
MFPNVTTDLPGPQNSTAAVFDWEPFSYYTSPWRELQLLWATICITLGVCGNTAVLLTISSVEELRTPGNALLCTLAVADILQVISKGPLTIWLMMRQQILSCQNYGLLISHFVYLTGSLFSVNIIGPISLDRYWYICFPLQYSSIMTKTRTALLAAVPLLLTVTIMVLLPFFEAGGEFYFFPPYVSCKFTGAIKRGRQTAINTCYGIVVLTMLFCYFKIWREVRRQQARHRQLVPQALSSVDSGQADVTGATRQTNLSRSSSVDSGSESQQASPDETGQMSRQVSVTSLSARLCDSASAGHKHGLKPDNKVAPARILKESSRSLEEPSAQPVSQKVPSEFKQRMKTATTVLLVIGVYFITWLPYFVVILRSASFGDEVASSLDGPWQRFAMLFSLISAWSNPIIYTRNRPFRQGFLRLIRCRN